LHCEVTEVFTTVRWLNDEARARVPASWRERVGDDRGEGVISAAIAVLVMAFLGAAMWIGFQRMWKSTESTTQTKVEQIGRE
jgi:hypothetical protein